ncbi:TPA: hypothetical protein DCG86_06620, partial [Candidatus Marinimicrobia bacterium]|nr:hypothetical protein [Candidatus Neomarinimicrobiota bacterium]
MTLVFVAGCGSSVSVQRTAADTQTDLSGYWNDTDSRLVAGGVGRDMNRRPRGGKFTSGKGGEGEGRGGEEGRERGGAGAE